MEQAKQAAVTQEQADMSKDAADPAMPCGNPIEPIDGLRKVAGPVPKAAFLLCLVECAERASYYGVRTVFSNFIQFPLPAGGNGAGAPPPGTQMTAGALGRGLQFSNAFILLFQFMVCIVPIFGGWLADVKLGRYTVVTLGVLIGALSHVLMAASATPSLLHAGQATAPFMISFFLLAVGTGLFKPNIVPMIIDQCRETKPRTKITASGEKVLVDPETTIQRIVLICYGLINVGALFGIPMAFSAKKVGFWLAFLAPGAIYLPLPFLLLFFRNSIARAPAAGGQSELSRFFKIILFALRRSKGKFWARNFWHLAKPSSSQPSARNITWTDKQVDIARRTVSACQMFILLFPLYHLNNGGVGSVATSQGASMTTNGAPNDLLNNINPLVIILATPLLTHVVYPILHRFHIPFGPSKRLTLGFTLAWTSGILGALLQWRVYETSPCGYQATECDAGVSPLSIWWQVPVVALGALSECFCMVTAYELAYARAPPNAKAMVTSLLIFSNALASVLGLVITPAVRDPYLVWVWVGPAVALFGQTCWFQWKYRELDGEEFMVEEEEEEVEEEEEGQDDVEGGSNRQA